MQFAPKHTPEGFRGGKLYRVLSSLGLTVGVGAGAVIAFALFFFSQFLVATPVGLYHRTWEAAQYFIYDPAAMGDWASWEHKFDDKIKTNEDAIKYANEMIKSLKDRYTRLESPEEVKANREQMEGNFTGVGIVLDVQVNAAGEPELDAKGQPKPAVDAAGHPIVREIMPGSPAEKAGLQAGDAVTTIDGVDTAGKSLEEIVTMIRNRAGTSVKFETSRAGVAQPAMNIVRAAIHRDTVKVEMLPGDIGYIRLDNFETFSATDEMIAAMQKLSGAKAIVLDLRNNPGGLVTNAINISSLFIEQGTVVEIRSRQFSSPDKPVWETETIKVTPQGTEKESRSSDSNNVTVERGSRKAYMLNGRPLVILVNGHSASASEMTTGAIRDNNAATVIGERTFGKGIGQSSIPMPNGTMLHITSLRYFTPNGTWLGDGGNSVSHGIQPDIEVKPATKNFKPGSAQDNQLKAAVDFLNKKLGRP